MGKNRRLAIIYLLVFVAIVALVIAFWPRGEKETPPNLSEVEQMVKLGQVTQIEVQDNRVLVVTPNEGEGDKFKTAIPEGYVGTFLAALEEYRVYRFEIATVEGAQSNLQISVIGSDSTFTTTMPEADVAILAAWLAGQAPNRYSVSLGADETLTIIPMTVSTMTDAFRTTIPEGDVAGLNSYVDSHPGVFYAGKYSSGFNWGSFLLTVIPLLMLVALFIFIMRGARGANSQAFNFSRSRARLADGAKPTVTFTDVAGVEEAKQELQEIVEFLKQPEKFLALGARIPRGVLLIGAPGTGKTLLARAIAGEAGVPFFSISGSEFVEMFVGVGASRVRDLFDQAKRNAPCIVFVDEIDAVGRHRGAGLGGGHDEREQTLNQILVEMDGFDTSTNVIVLAATNRPDILDPALLRPGRFDRRVVLDPPDIIGRTGILQVHAKGKPLDPSVSLETISRQTVGFSGADLANLVNEAAILAARRNKKSIGMIEFEEAIDRVIAGPEKKSRIINAKEKEITAYHEAGHALVAKKLPNADPVHKVSIVARGMIGGYTRLLPTEDRNMITRSQLMDRLSVLVAGHVAEEIVFNEKTTGPHDDIERVTKIARSMVTEYGMSDRLELRTFGHREELVFLGKEISEQRNYSERVALEIDREVRNIIQKAYDVAKAILMENKPKLVQIAQRLVAEESLEGEKLEKVFSEPVPAAPAQT